MSRFGFLYWGYQLADSVSAQNTRGTDTGGLETLIWDNIPSAQFLKRKKEIKTCRKTSAKSPIHRSTVYKMP